MNPPGRPFRPLPRSRPLWLAGVFALGFLAVLGRDIQVQYLQTGQLRAQGQMRYLHNQRLPAQRGVIFGDNGLPLAVNTAASTIWGDPKILGKHQDQWPQLAKALHLSVIELGQRLASGGADFAYLARQRPPSVGKTVRALGIPGVGVLPSSRSYFPLGAATTPLIGLVDQAHQGATGMELSYNQ